MTDVSDLVARLSSGGEVIRLEVIAALEALQRERDEALKALKAEAERDRLRERVEVLKQALEPFALFAERFDAHPIRGLDDAIYTIHGGMEFEAALLLSDCREAKRLLEAPHA